MSEAVGKAQEERMHESWVIVLTTVPSGGHIIFFTVNVGALSIVK